MVFDSVYDEFRGAVTYVRIMNGTVRKGQRIRFLQAGTTHDVIELGQFTPRRVARDQLTAGQVGYLICNIKSLGNIHIGDTVTVADGEPAPALPGYQEPKRMVFCGLYPSDGQDFEQLRDALDKLSINDPSFEFEPETSDALGFGFRCGFLGLLHMEIVQQRLEQDADIDLVQTAPNVTYEITTTSGEELEVHTPQKVPDQGEIEEFRQPIVRVNFVLPTEYIGPIMKFCTDRRGEYVRTEYLSPTRAMLTYDLALADVIYDMHDKLKSATRGYGTMDYEILGYRPGDLVRLDILVKGDRIDALSIVCDRRDAEIRGRAVIKKLKQEIPRHMFEVPLQAAIGEPHYRPGNHQRNAQERHRQMLRRRHHPQTQTVGETKGRQEADEIDRPGRHPAKGVSGRPRNRRRGRKEEIAPGSRIKPRPSVAHPPAAFSKPSNSESSVRLVASARPAMFGGVCVRHDSDVYFRYYAQSGRQMRCSVPNRRGFSLIEMVIVVMILGILGSIAAPKLLGTSQQAIDNGLRQTLSVIRTAIDSYSAEHAGELPGADGPEATFKNAMKQYLRGR